MREEHEKPHLRFLFIAELGTTNARGKYGVCSLVPVNIYMNASKKDNVPN